MKRVLGWTVWTMLAVMFLGVSACAKVVYVNQNAPGTTHNGASWSTAYTTVTSGFNAAVTGDEVWVAKGTYAGSLSLTKRVNLYGGFGGTETARSQRDWNANATVLDGGGATNAVLCFSAGIVLDGFTVRNGKEGVYVFSTATLSNNTISGNSEDGVDVDINGTATLTNNTVSGNSKDGVYIFGTANVHGTAALTNNAVSGNGGGVNVPLHATATLTSNSFSGNNTYGVSVFGTAVLTNNTVFNNSGYGVYVGGAVEGSTYVYGTATLNNNTVVGNRYCGVWLEGGTAGLTNNILAFNDEYGAYQSTTLHNGVIYVYSTFSHNDVFGNRLANYSGYTPPSDQGNISVDPLFLNTASGDFHLAAGSPCIDAGDDSVMTPGETDKDGKPRKSGAHVDMGAYEFNFAPYVPTTLAASSVTEVSAQLNGTVNPGTGGATAYFEWGTDSTYGHTTAVQTLGTVQQSAPVQAALSGLLPGKTYHFRLVSVSGGTTQQGQDATFTTLRPPRTLYINQSATGAVHDGASWATAYTTIASGLNAAVSGDEMWVAKGTYKETLAITSGVSLYGGFAGTETQRSQRDWKTNPTVLDGGGQTVVGCGTTGIVVDGFTVRNGGDGVYVGELGQVTVANNMISGNSGIGVIVYGGQATLTNNTISGNSGYGVTMNGGPFALNNNTVSGNSKDGLYVADGTATITNNTILNNGGYGVLVGRAAIMNNNTVSGNSGGGVHVEGTAALTNNIVAFNGSYEVNNDASGAVSTFSHNDVFSNTQANYTGYTPPSDQGDISVDPLFSNTASGDFHLTSGSPCVNAGDDSVVTPGETDKDGKPRLLGAHVDIGVYEYGTTAFSEPDAARALLLAAGLIPSIPNDAARLNVVNTGTSSSRVDILDAVRLVRKAAGLDPNP